MQTDRGIREAKTMKRRGTPRIYPRLGEARGPAAGSGAVAWHPGSSEEGGPHELSDRWCEWRVWPDCVDESRSIVSHPHWDPARGVA